MSKQAEFAVILKMNPMFADLGPDELQRISNLCHTQHLASGEVLFQKGDPGNALFGVRRGQVRIETGASDGSRLTLNFLGAGDLFGLIFVPDVGVYFVDDGKGWARLASAPRSGLAVGFNRARSVFRAGYGIFYARYPGAMINSMFTTNNLYQQTLTLQTSQVSQWASAPLFPNLLAAPSGTPRRDRPLIRGEQGHHVAGGSLPPRG